MKILFADALPESHVQQLRDAGHECVLEPSLTADQLPQHMQGVEILIVRSTEVTAETIDAADELSLIVRAGAGTNNIDKQHAANVGVSATSRAATPWRWPN